MDWYDAQEENNTETVPGLPAGKILDDSIFFEMNPSNCKNVLSFPKFNMINDTVDALYAVLRIFNIASKL